MNQSLKAKVARKFRYSGWMKALQYATGSNLQPRKWVFIVGCYNSGTTLLEDLIARHELTRALEDEGTVLTGYLNRPEDYGWTRMWARCEAEVSLDAHTDPQLARRIKRHWSHFYRDPADRLLLEKSIVNATRIPFFDRFFAPAYFIYIRRNGYAVAEGIHRKATPGDYPQQHVTGAYPYALCAEQWRRSAEVIERDLAGVEHRLDLSYEELCAAPGDTLNRIAGFLDIPPFRPEVWEGKHTVHGMESTIRNQNAGSLKRLSAADFAEINRIARPYLERYGYYQAGPTPASP